MSFGGNTLRTAFGGLRRKGWGPADLQALAPGTEKKRDRRDFESRQGGHAGKGGTEFSNIITSRSLEGEWGGGKSSLSGRGGEVGQKRCEGRERLLYGTIRVSDLLVEGPPHFSLPKKKTGISLLRKGGTGEDMAPFAHGKGRKDGDF